MRLICPSCGAIHSAEAWSGNVDARQCIRLVAELPSSVARNVLPYIALFRPVVPENERGYRGLIWQRALRLTGEVLQLTGAGTVEWKGRPARPIEPAVWGLAMERMLANPPRRLPLESHGYLISIAYELADEADRAREVRHNAAERDGSLRREIAAGRPGEDAPAEPLAPEVLRAIRNKNMGRK
jgi:hypothetical protein